MFSHLQDKLVVITAPSGAGKTTIIKSLLDKNPEYGFSISHTTRLPRKNETQGSDYFFISQAIMKEKISNDEMIEWALVHGNYYGTSVKQIENKLKDFKKIVLDIDVQGSLQIQEKNIFY